MASMVCSNSRWALTLAAATTAPRGPPSRSTRRLCLVPALPRSVGFFPTFFPPEPGLAQPPIGALPVPVDAAQFGAALQQQGPDAGEHAAAAPALEPAVDGTVVAELLGQVVPLAAAAQAEEDAVQDASPVGAGAASPLGRGGGQPGRLGLLPQGSGEFPNGVHDPSP